MRKRVGFLIPLTLAGVLVAGLPAQNRPVRFVSTQLNPAQEATIMRNVLLEDFPAAVDFLPYNDIDLISYLKTAEGKPAILPDLIGGSYGDFLSLYRNKLIQPLGSIGQGAFSEDKMRRSYLDMGRFEGGNLYFVPWMQASFIMVANRKALTYLPSGADINRLSYSELMAWGRSIRAATGEKRLGFPAGQSGLMHRFLEGYLYPSYTGTMTRDFASKAAVAMWRDFRALWETVNPKSLTFNRMDDPLLSEEVWIAWDHTARIIKVFQERSEDFVAFPAPSGPEGRGFITVLAGLGFPAGKAIDAGAIELVRYLTDEGTQVLTANSTGFFPVLNALTAASADRIDGRIRYLIDAVLAQASLPDATVGVTPVGLGNRSDEFNKVYMSAFSQIVLAGRDIEPILTVGDAQIAAILADLKLNYWPPDNYAKTSR